MPKLAIYVPKKQMKLVEKWRKRLNFSQIFMRALRAEIASRSSQTSAAGHQLAKAAEFYKEQMADSLDDCGFQLGSRHLLECCVPKDVVARFLRLHESASFGDDDYQLIKEQLGPEAKVLRDIMSRSGFPEADGLPPEFAVAYVRGIADAWRRITELPTHE